MTCASYIYLHRQHSSSSSGCIIDGRNALDALQIKPGITISVVANKTTFAATADANFSSLILAKNMPMKLNILDIIALLTTIFLAAPVKAENPIQVKRLLLTGECPNCNLVGANLRGAHLIGADLRNANLQGAILVDANLEGADLTWANLKEANLTGAFISGTSFNDANLTNVNFTGVQLYDADVTGAVLHGINNSGAEVFNTGISIGGD